MGINVWNDLTEYLDEDERLVFPDMYISNRELYDSIRDVVYVVKDRDDSEGGFCWVKEAALGRVLKNLDVELLGKLLIVRLRLPWSDLVPTDWLISQEELDKNREYYDVLDVYLRVKHNDVDGIMPVFDKVEFEQNRNNYEVIEAQYLVSLKLSTETKAQLIGIPPEYYYDRDSLYSHYIDPDSIHTYMSE